jgi:N-acetylmuramoyl-L-alanine amidase/Bacterial Ig domain
VRTAALVTALSVVTPIPASWSNYSHHHRPASDLRLVVVHVSEGSYGGTVAWFRNPRAHAAANYVVGRDGRIAHMVPDNEVAWHAGNGYVNAHSIGIEHEGYTGIDGTFTDAEYRASARLLASLLRRYHLPANRGRIIGHNQVPDPNHRGLLGGFAHHTDPGEYWDWPRYMDYVRAYSAGNTPPPRPLDVTIAGLGLGQSVTGLVPFTAVPAGEVVERVDFLVDGVVRASVEQAPYSWGWDTALEQNGRHILTARAIGEDGRSAIATVVVESNTPPPPPPTVTLPPLPPLTGVVALQPAVSGAVARVELWIDGYVVQTATAAPWTLTWDLTNVTRGDHTLAIRAVGPKGAANAAATLVTVPSP